MPAMPPEPGTPGPVTRALPGPGTLE
jgi:hypothetical protein